MLASVGTTARRSARRAATTTSRQTLVSTPSSAVRFFSANDSYAPAVSSTSSKSKRRSGPRDPRNDDPVEARKRWLKSAASPEALHRSAKQKYDSVTKVSDSNMVRNYQVKVVTVQRVSNMRKTGRVSSVRALVVSGNGRASGFGTGKAVGDARLAIARAVNNSLKDWVPMNFTPEGGLYHDVKGHFNGTDVLLRATPPQGGVVGQRIVQGISGVSGLKHCTTKVSGNTNPFSVVNAIYNALGYHQTPEEVAAVTGERLVVVNPYARWRRSNERGRRERPADDDLPVVEGDNWY